MRRESAEKALPASQINSQNVLNEGRCQFRCDVVRDKRDNVTVGGQGGAQLSLAGAVRISALLFLTSPTATHAITRAAHVDGRDPWTAGDARDPAARGGQA